MLKFKTDRSRNTTLPVVVHLLGAGVFVLGTAEFGVAGLLPEMAAGLGVDLPAAGWVISAHALAMAVGTPLIAVATLRASRRTVLLAALAAFVVAQAMAALAPSLPVLLGARVLGALATGAFWSAGATVIVAAVPVRHRARALSVQMAGLTLATVVGVPLGTLAGQQFGWRATFWLLAAGAVVAAAAALVAVPGGHSVERPDLRAELRAFAAGPVWSVLAVVVVFQTAVIGCFGYLAPLVADVGGSAALVPVALALFGAGSLLGVQLGGRLADRHPRTTLLAALAGLVVALPAIALAAAQPAVTLAATFLLGAAAFAASPAANGRVFALAAAAPTLAGAVSASAFNVGATLGPWLGGLTLTAGWGLRGPAALGTGLAVAALALAAVTARVGR